MKVDAFYYGVFGLLILSVLLVFKQVLNDFILTCVLIVFSVLGMVAAYDLMPHMGEKCISKGLFGLDINKGTQDKVPESMGLVTSLVFMFVTITFSALSTNVTYIISLLVILFSFVIGLVDDFLDIRWRYKLVLSFCSSILVITLYPGSCNIFGFDLSYFYMFALICLSVFFTNSINMFAGVNGLESGQCLIISFFSILHNIITIYTYDSTTTQYSTALTSLYILIPFFTTTLTLFYYNKFPSKVFVGDSFTYFAGGVLGVAAIVGGYDRLMFIFFLPEFINFFLSIPQLFGFIYCPRHRLPKLNKETKLLECVTSHHTFLNLILFLVGPKSEHQLVNIAFVFHICSCVLSMFLAYVVFPNFLLDHF